MYILHTILSAYHICARVDQPLLLGMDTSVLAMGKYIPSVGLTGASTTRSRKVRVDCPAAHYFTDESDGDKVETNHLVRYPLGW